MTEQLKEKTYNNITVELYKYTIKQLYMHDNGTVVILLVNSVTRQ